MTRSLQLVWATTAMSRGGVRCVDSCSKTHIGGEQVLNFFESSLLKIFVGIAPGR